MNSFFEKIKQTKLTNIYYNLNNQNFDALVELVYKSPTKYTLKLDSKGRKREPNVVPKFKYLKTWIDKVLSNYTTIENMHTSTKVYWILNNLTQFPTCKYCNNSNYYKTYKVSLFTGYPTYCSAKCIHNSQDIKIKTKTTCLKKYVVENPYQSDSIKKKIEQTKIAKYGNKNFKNKDKAIQTKINHENTIPHYKQNILEKQKTTCLKKYGVENVMFDPIFKQKSNNNYKLTMLEKYGVISPWKLDNVQLKCEDTNLNRYGVRRPIQNCSIFKKIHKKYLYNNIMFDSAPELAYYIWLKDNHIKFEYQPSVQFEYKYDEKIHYYMPDFKVDNKYIELKGDQFLKSDGTWQCPFDHSLDAIYEAKHQCLIKNNVQIFYSDEYIQYIEYVKQLYGKTYLQTFKQK